MVYIFYGVNDFLIGKEVSKLKSSIDSFNFVKYDLENTLLTDIMIDADEISLFGDKKMILVENSYIFTGTTNKKLLEQDTSPLENYFKNPNPNTILVFTIVKDKLDERKKIVKLAKEKGFIREFNKVDDFNKVLETMFQPYLISKENIKLFLNRVGENMNLLEQEVNKIKIYKDQDLTVTREDILALTTQNIDTDIFNLIDNILMEHKKEAIDSYHEMLKLGEEPIMITILLANQIRLLYQVKVFAKLGYNEKRIADELKVHWYPVRKALSRIQSYSEEKLLQYLYELSDIDIKIKTGLLDKDLALEFFILEV
jgi:DNA polymerase-3 subunit delta